MVFDGVLADDLLTEPLVVMFRQSEQHTVVILHGFVETPPRLRGVPAANDSACGPDQRYGWSLVVNSSVELDSALTVA